MRLVSNNGSKARSREIAFTLIELVLVILIIGAITAISLPALKGITQAHTVNSASQQLMDDLALARQYAMKNRSVVHVLFVPPDIARWTFNAAPDLVRRLLAGPYTTYAIYAERTVGDQPGQSHPRYLTKWKALPNGVFVSTNEFAAWTFRNWENQLPNPLGRPFSFASPDPNRRLAFRFPTIANAAVELPHVTFNAQGNCVFLDSDYHYKPADEVIELSRGSILAVRDDSGTLIYFDARESPPNNSVDNYNRIRIDGLTGRCKLERPEVP